MNMRSMYTNTDSDEEYEIMKGIMDEHTSQGPDLGDLLDGLDISLNEFKRL